MNQQTILTLGSDADRKERAAWFSLLPAAVLPLVVLLVFLIAPGGLAEKTHTALHGLCAQRPSHSLVLGGQTLPLDARMTGIYLGAATTFGWLLLSGRSRAAKSPPRSVVAMLAAFVVTLAMDGLNGLLVDLAAPHPYEPSHVLRLATGTLAGIALGVVLGQLFASSVWVKSDRTRPVVDRPLALLPAGAIAAALGTLALSGLPILFSPFAVGLLVAAVIVFWALSVVVLTLVTDRGWSHRTYGELGPTAVVAFALAIGTIAGLAGLRSLAESIFALPRLT